MMFLFNLVIFFKFQLWIFPGFFGLPIRKLVSFVCLVADFLICTMVNHHCSSPFGRICSEGTFSKHLFNKQIQVPKHPILNGLKDVFSWGYFTPINGL